MCRRSCTRSASSSSWSVPCCGSWAPPVAPLGDAATTGDRRVSTARTADLWWKNAIVYCLDVETFLDSDGDGCGDLAGLTERVDHLAGIGVTCVWLMPFYASPNRDDGYDVTDFYSVDERLGSLGDFVVFVRTAKDRGLRVLIDLVVNHTSDQHPWFRAARESRECPTATTTSGATSPPRSPPRRWCSPMPRTASGPSTRWLGSTICTTSTPTSRTSTSPRPRCARRSPRSRASGCSSAWTASGSTRCRSCWRRAVSPARSTWIRTGCSRTCARSSPDGGATRCCWARSTCRWTSSCLLYTSDAADDLLCVDLGGRRIIKKKKKK